MKNINIIFIALVAGSIISVSISSCTDLDEEPTSTITPDKFFQTEEEFISSLGAAYTRLYGFVGTIYPLSEITSDEMVIPVRGQDWVNPFNRQMHLNTWTSQHGGIRNLWNFCFGGISTCNRLIFQLETVGGAGSNAFIAEIKTLRALWYLYLIDFYGNVPIVDRFDVPEDFAPSNANNRGEVFNFIESTVLEGLDDLSKAVDLTTYARVNYWVAQSILAKLYLNAEIYTGTTQWVKAETAIDEIINQGEFNLASNYFANFNLSNSNSPEFIFAIPYDKINAGGFNLYSRTLHYSSGATFNLSQQPWNGYAAVADFYESYIDPGQNPGPQGPVIGRDGGPATGTLDIRLGNMLAGPQFTSDGSTPILDPGFEKPDPNDTEKPFDPDGEEINFTPEINELQPNALRQSGARVAKWEYESGSTSRNMDNDWAIFRFTDILLMKAEVRLRQGDAATGLVLVNQIRERAGVDPFTELTMDNLLAERGREMFSEAWRRSDLIRFGVNNDAWWEKPVTDSHVNIFPIPQSQIDANPNLVQNPGY